MPGRQFSSGNGYRYGFGGHEKDDQVSGSGNHLSFGDYGYNPRIGRRWNLAPRPNPSISSYATFANNPIWFSDALGDTIIDEQNRRVNFNVEQNDAGNLKIQHENTRHSPKKAEFYFESLNGVYNDKY